MNKAKPIEPGCMALIVDSLPEFRWLVGRVVTVIGQTNYPEFMGEWDLDLIDPLTGENFCGPENCLLRIDDPEIQDQLETERSLERLKDGKKSIPVNVEDL